MLTVMPNPAQINHEKRFTVFLCFTAAATVVLWMPKIGLDLFVLNCMSRPEGNRFRRYS